MKVHAICAATAISHLTDAQHIYPTPSFFYFPPSHSLLSSWLPSIWKLHSSLLHTLFCCSANKSVWFFYILYSKYIPTHLQLNKTSGRIPVIVGLPNWIVATQIWQQKSLFSLQWTEIKSHVDNSCQLWVRIIYSELPSATHNVSSTQTVLKWTTHRIVPWTALCLFAYQNQ